MHIFHVLTVKIYFILVHQHKNNIIWMLVWEIEVFRGKIGYVYYQFINIKETISRYRVDLVIFKVFMSLNM